MTPHSKPKYIRFLIRIIDKSFKILNRVSRAIGGPIILYKLHSNHDGYVSTRPSESQEYLRDIAILMQGPINQNLEASVRSLKLYKSLWPKIPVIISTWDSSIPEYINVLSREGADIVFVKEPLNPGISNSNYQICSTLAGLERSEQLGSRFTLKTRVDQSINNIQSLRILKKTFEDYGNRIVTTDFNSFLFRLFSPNDQLMFSETQKLLQFWNASSSRVGFDDIPGPVESKFLISFLDSDGLTVEQSIQNSLKIYRDIYAFVNFEDLDLLWHKGNYRDLRSRFPQEDYPSITSFIRNHDWMNLQSNLDMYIQDYNLIQDRLRLIH